MAMAMAETPLVISLFETANPTNVRNTFTKIDDPLVRRLTFLFGRCGIRGLETYIQTILKGTKSPTWTPPVFDYEYIPYMPRKLSPNTNIYKKSLEKFPMNLVRTFQTRSNPNSNLSGVFETYAHTPDFTALKTSLKGQGNKFAYPFVKLMEDNILQENIPYCQGYDALALDFLLMVPQQAKHLHYYFLREYLFGDVTLGHTYTKILSHVLQITDRKKYNNTSKTDIGLFLNNIIAYISQKSFSSSTRINNKIYSINSTIRAVLYDLLLRTSPYFIIYFIGVLFKHYFEIKEDEEEMLYEVQKFLYKFSIHQLNYAMTRQGITGISVEKFEETVEAQTDRSACITSLRLFEPDSPFRMLVADTMQFMVRVLPHELVQSALTRDEYDAFKRSDNKHLIYDPYSVYNAYGHMQLDFEDRLAKPIKYGPRHLSFWKKGAIGIAGTPKPSGSVETTQTLSECIKEIDSPFNELNQLFYALDYTRVVIDPLKMHDFILLFNDFHEALKKSKACQKLSRIESFASNIGTTVTGDIVFLKRLAQPFLNYPISGGKRRHRTRKSKGLRRHTLKRR